MLIIKIAVFQDNMEVCNEPLSEKTQEEENNLDASFKHLEDSNNCTLVR